MDDDRFRKIISSQLKSLNTDMVSQKKSLKELLNEKEPSVKTRKGSKHKFDREHLKKIEGSIPLNKKYELKLPIMVYNDPSLDQCYVKKRVEAELLKELIGLNNKTIKDDKTWFSKPLITEIIREYDDIFQLIWTPKLNRKISYK